MPYTSKEKETLVDKTHVSAPSKDQENKHSTPPQVNKRDVESRYKIRMYDKKDSYRMQKNKHAPKETNFPLGAKYEDSSHIER